ncbi:hypothetical protein H8K90_09375 [Winogradskyella echinorum]|uniref:Uncharacterized protein n=1 Tax=Winogradskyella echinorum TaxID=538189 RepID=A0ABR6Y2Y2_9FLAO|nr:hypothetical protein [Winogradskyella echinorum]MBC3846588.1 hypothetical protein [Winogradskyella echinorum]MBC5750936.1 hypothetical protein [Winogradskyella echinorum]
MTITNSNVASQIVKQTQSKVGTVHFFNHIAVIEFNEGTHIDINSVKKTLKDIRNYFGDSKPFGIVANRVNSYSISLLDVKDARRTLPNLAAYGIVSYNSATRMNAEIESSFCEWKDICFNNLYEGLDTIYHRVNGNQLISSLN